ncbi:MAG: EipA family protein [Hyphomicrobiaceae bacterium]
MGVTLAVLLTIATPVRLATAAPAPDAAACTPESFAAAVDDAGARLREFNARMSPEVQARLKALQKARSWSDAQAEEQAIQQLHDQRIAALDAEANALLSRIDDLGELGTGARPDCSKLDDLQRAAAELLAVMRRKSEYTLAKLDRAISDASDTRSPARTNAPAHAPTNGSSAPGSPGSAAPAPATDKPRTAGNASDWDTRTTALAPPPPPPSADVALTAPPSAGGPAGGPVSPGQDGFTIEEIREATRGFFGSISTGLAGVIEHAFSSYGRPTGYVLGAEGGGAFLAGVRYGKGKLYMRAGGMQTVYWHGPSLGYDFGAEGSRTLFLVYSLAAPEGLYRRFVGVDGSAYLVGGVGMTLLKGGNVLMAPIRTGLGLRLGANVGYVRFTPHPTWNPF